MNTVSPGDPLPGVILVGSETLEIVGAPPPGAEDGVPEGAVVGDVVGAVVGDVLGEDVPPESVGGAEPLGADVAVCATLASARLQ